MYYHMEGKMPKLIQYVICATLVAFISFFGTTGVFSKDRILRADTGSPGGTRNHSGNIRS